LLIESGSPVTSLRGETQFKYHKFLVRAFVTLQTFGGEGECALRLEAHESAANFLL
jgi:hypothetical protein